jgi:hypothetical protein
VSSTATAAERSTGRKQERGEDSRAFSDHLDQSNATAGASTLAVGDSKSFDSKFDVRRTLRCLAT